MSLGSGRKRAIGVSRQKQRTAATDSRQLGCEGPGSLQLRQSGAGAKLGWVAIFESTSAPWSFGFQPQKTGKADERPSNCPVRVERPGLGE